MRVDARRSCLLWAEFVDERDEGGERLRRMFDLDLPTTSFPSLPFFSSLSGAAAFLSSERRWASFLDLMRERYCRVNGSSGTGGASPSLSDGKSGRMRG